MPLSESGAKVKASMKSQYGATKGERIFHATAAKKPSLGAKWHGPSTSRAISKR